MKRSSLKRHTPLKPGGGLRRSQENRRRKELKRRKFDRRMADEPARQAFREAAAAQGCCAVSGSNRSWDAHHVIERQELRRRGENEFDTRNALRLTKRVHERHTTGVQRVPLHCLTDENVQYAVELMGLAAHVYLRRMYSGKDERLELAIAELGAPDACG